MQSDKSVKDDSAKNPINACVFCRDAEVRTMIPREMLPDNIAVLRCRRCTLVYLENRGNEGEEDFEERAYWKGDQKKVYMQEQVQKVFMDEFELRLDALKKFGKSSGLLLDVGCGVGHFLHSAKKRNWNVEGLDISPVAREAAQEKYGIDVKVGTLDANELPANTYDVVSLWDVIEHIKKPIENMEAANRVLKIGGIIVMKTPNEGSLYKWLVRTFYKIFGRQGSFLLKYVYYAPHYFSYSEKTMNILLEKTGFEVVSYELDETPEEFGVEKINVHYKKDPKRSIVIALLPFVKWLSRVLKRQNKLVVYAKKVRDLS